MYFSLHIKCYCLNFELFGKRLMVSCRSFSRQNLILCKESFALKSHMFTVQ